MRLKKDYTGQFLLDITKDIIFHQNDVSAFLGQGTHRSIYQAALTHIIGHEIAHISHGHLDFKASPEYLSFCTSEEDRNLTLRALEMDADSSATSSVFDIFERIISIGDSGKPYPKDRALLFRRHYISGILLSTIYHDSLTSNFTPLKYPGSYARFLTIPGGGYG